MKIAHRERAAGVPLIKGNFNYLMWNLRYKKLKLGQLLMSQFTTACHSSCDWSFSAWFERISINDRASSFPRDKNGYEDWKASCFENFNFSFLIPSYHHHPTHMYTFTFEYTHYITSQQRLVSLLYDAAAASSLSIVIKNPYFCVFLCEWVLFTWTNK